MTALVSNDTKLQQSEVTAGLVKNSHEEVYQQQANMRETPLSNKHFRENGKLKQSQEEFSEAFHRPSLVSHSNISIQKHIHSVLKHEHF